MANAVEILTFEAPKAHLDGGTWLTRLSFAPLAQALSTPAKVQLDAGLPGIVLGRARPDFAGPCRCVIAIRKEVR